MGTVYGALERCSDATIANNGDRPCAMTVGLGTNPPSIVGLMAIVMTIFPQRRHNSKVWRGRNVAWHMPVSCGLWMMGLMDDGPHG